MDERINETERLSDNELTEMFSGIFDISTEVPTPVLSETPLEVPIEESETEVLILSNIGVSDIITEFIKGDIKELEIRDEKDPVEESNLPLNRTDPLSFRQITLHYKTIGLDGEMQEFNTIYNISVSILESLKDELSKISLPIEPNKDVLLVTESTSRFNGAMWYEQVQKADILLAGVGGIGSYVAFLLSRMRPGVISVYDPDTVETVNLSGQLFLSEHIGKPKVAAICDVANRASNYQSINSYSEPFTSTSPTEDVMICGFDNMAARKVFFEAWLERVKESEDKSKLLFIDGRLAAEELQVLAMTGDDEYSIKAYTEDWLFDDSEAEETVCSYKQTTFMANMIGSLIVNIFVNFEANQCGPIIPRDVPFYTYYSAENMFFKTKNE